MAPFVSSQLSCGYIFLPRSLAGFSVPKYLPGAACTPKFAELRNSSSDVHTTPEITGAGTLSNAAMQARPEEESTAEGLIVAAYRQAVCRGEGPRGGTPFPGGGRDVSPRLGRSIYEWYNRRNPHFASGRAY